MMLKRLRHGELLALIGAVALAVLSFLPWYHGAGGNRSAWDSFGVADVLIVIAVLAGFALALATVTERTTALPVAAAVWTTFWGLPAVVTIIVRLFDTPGDAPSLRPASWLSVLAALAVLGGGCLSMRDERTELYPPAQPEPRPVPTGAPPSVRGPRADGP